MHVRTSHSLAGCLATAALVASMAVQAVPNSVVNGDFETGDFTDWTQFGDTSFNGVDTNAPQSGVYGAFFGPVNGAGGISQTLLTTAGRDYNIDFWLQNEADANSTATPNSFAFNWNGGPTEMVLVDAPAFGYTHYSFILPATSATTNLSFAFEHLPAFWDLDAVSATVPEPGSLALVVLAGGLVALARRRRGA
jgi:hypothetical protein